MWPTLFLHQKPHKIAIKLLHFDVKGLWCLGEDICIHSMVIDQLIAGKEACSQWDRLCPSTRITCMLAWLRNVNIAILVSHVSWNVLTSSTLLAQPCICTIALNGHARISNLHCQFLCCCALLQVKISLKKLSQNASRLCADASKQPHSHRILLQCLHVRQMPGSY